MTKEIQSAADRFGVCDNSEKIAWGNMIDTRAKAKIGWRAIVELRRPMPDKFRYTLDFLGDRTSGIVDADGKPYSSESAFTQDSHCEMLKEWLRGDTGGFWAIRTLVKAWQPAGDDQKGYWFREGPFCIWGSPGASHGYFYAAAWMYEPGEIQHVPGVREWEVTAPLHRVLHNGNPYKVRGAEPTEEREYTQEVQELHEF